MGSTLCGAALSPTTLAERCPALLFLCPLPSRSPDGASLLGRLAARTLFTFPIPLLVAELGGLPLFGSLPVDIEGEGEDVDE